MMVTPDGRLRERGRVHADTATGATRVGGQRESQHVNGFGAAPQHGPVASVEPAEPVAPGIAEAAGPVVIEGVVRAHLPIGVNLEARLLDASACAPVHPGEATPPSHFPTFVVGVVV